MTVKERFEQLNAEKKQLADDFLEYIEDKGLKHKQSEVYSSLTLEELYNSI